VSNTPERDEVLFQTNTWWYTVGLFLSIEQTFALASPSNNPSWKTNTVRSLSLLSVAYRVCVCARISGFAKATWMNSSFSWANSVWLWSVSRPEPLILPDSFYADVFGCWQWSVSRALTGNSMSQLQRRIEREWEIW